MGGKIFSDCIKNLNEKGKVSRIVRLEAKLVEPFLVFVLLPSALASTLSRRFSKFISFLVFKATALERV